MYSSHACRHRLQVESDDLYRANLLDASGKRLILVRINPEFERLPPAQDFDTHVASSLDLAVDRRFDDGDQFLLQPLELKIHAPLSGSISPPVTCAP